MSKHRCTKEHNLREWLISAAVCIGLLVFIGFIIFVCIAIINFEKEADANTIAAAIAHGADEITARGEDANNETLKHYIKNTPVQNPPTGEHNHILVYIYRFDCSDCHTIHEEVQRKIEYAEYQGITIYTIATRSEQGAEFIKEFPVTSVPTLMYITPNGQAITRSLYSHTVEFLDHEWNELIDLYKTFEGDKS